MGARGEGIILAGEAEVRVLYTNRALAEAEQALGKSVIGVAQGFVNGDSGILELAQVLRAGMEAARREAREARKPITLNEAYEVLDEAGFAAVAEVVLIAVAEVLSYGTANEGELPNV